MIFKKWLKMFGNNKADQAVKDILNSQAAKPPVDTRLTVHKGVWALLAGLAFLVLWAAFAPLSQGVPVHGFIKVEGNRKTIQHLRGGLVEAILVKEGQKVRKDQPLLRLDETQVKAQLGIIESQLFNALATEARLTAEQSGAADVKFSALLEERRADAMVSEIMLTQRQLFQTRRLAQQGEESIGLQMITGLQEQIRGIEAQEKARAQQLRLYNEELNALRPMYEQGFVPRNRMFELERAIALLGGQRSEDLANIARARSQISELQLKILQGKELYRKDVQTLLAEVQRQLADLRERLVVVQDDLKRVVVRSPVEGVVVDMTVFTHGGVVAPGQKLMDVVPRDQHLQVEVQIPTQLIDNVKPGLHADVHFSALDRFEVPRIPGKLVYVSADRLTDPRTSESYFLGRIEVSAEGLSMLGAHEIQLGMPADVVIITGERSFLSYLVRPLMARLHFAFTER